MNILWISQTAFRCLTVEADRAYPLETGGVLVGYVADNGAPVILEVIGPGEGATHKVSFFFPDHSWQCQQIDSTFVSSGGLSTYIGDWHTHPNGSPRMSLLDRRTLAEIARHPGTRLARPLMLIGGGDCQNRHWVGHQFNSTRFCGLWAANEECMVKVFDDSTAYHLHA